MSVITLTSLDPDVYQSLQTKRMRTLVLQTAENTHLLNNLLMRKPIRNLIIEVDLGEDLCTVANTLIGSRVRRLSISWQSNILCLHSLLRHHPLTILSLSNNQITGDIMYRLVQAMKMHPPRELDLHANEIGINTDVLAPVVRQVETFDLSRNQIGDLGLQILSRSLLHNTTLHTLSLEENGIGDEGIFYLAHALAHSALEVLNLSGNMIQDNGVMSLYLALLARDTYMILDLRNNLLTSLGVSYLRQLPDLIEVYV